MQIIEVKNQLVSTIALIDDENKILIGKRPVGKVFENLWEFPGGKVKKNETVEQALIREIKEEINIYIIILIINPTQHLSSILLQVSCYSRVHLQ